MVGARSAFAGIAVLARGLAHKFFGVRVGQGQDLHVIGTAPEGSGVAADIAAVPDRGGGTDLRQIPVQRRRGPPARWSCARR